MVEKEIILLTKSTMINHFCTAGIDTKTGEWVRIVSPDTSTQHAVTEADMTYSDGRVAKVFDVVRVKCLEHRPTFCQPENFLLDRRYHWEWIGTSTMRQVLQIHKPERNAAIFYNTSYKVSDSDLEKIADKDRHSLTLVDPGKFIVVKEENPWSHKLQYFSKFIYCGNTYNFMRITDPVFKAAHDGNPLGQINNLPDSYFVVSLANNPIEEHGENMHYKLIATILHK